MNPLPLEDGTTVRMRGWTHRGSAFVFALDPDAKGTYLAMVVENGRPVQGWDCASEDEAAGMAANAYGRAAWGVDADVLEGRTLPSSEGREN
jgi:hypothetical protein